MSATRPTARNLERLTSGRWHDLARRYGAVAFSAVTDTGDGPVRFFFSCRSRNPDETARDEADHLARQLSRHPGTMPDPATSATAFYTSEKEPHDD